MSAFEVVVIVNEGENEGEHIFPGSDENVAIRKAKKFTKKLLRCFLCSFSKQLTKGKILVSFAAFLE